jgi:hypothetical protein
MHGWTRAVRDPPRRRHRGDARAAHPHRRLGAQARRRPPQQSDAKAAEGLSTEELGEVPCHELSRAGAGVGDCAVCLEAFQAGDRCRVMPGCEHGFHAACVDSWLRKSRVCPICRAEVVTRLGEAAGAVAASEVGAERQCGADR